MSQSRDIDGDYKAAYLHEYAGYVRAGRTAEAKIVAGILRKRFGVEVDPKPKVETTAAAAPPETTEAPKPRGRPRKNPLNDSE
jgi:hypothetical protein